MLYSRMQLNLPNQLSEQKPARLAIKIRPSAEKLIRNEQHPWIFDQSIVKQNKSGQAGDVAVVFDRKSDKFLACGLFDPNSPIRIKLLQYKTPSAIDGDWFYRKVEIAKSKRAPLLKGQTNAYRLLFGENDGLPGVIVDVYDKVAVIKLYSVIWFPYLNDLLPAIIRHAAPSCVVLRLSRNVEARAAQMGLENGAVVYGDLQDEEVIIQEYDVRFRVNVVRGHKTGFFLDHRQNRRIIGERSKGKSVLDVFCYAGGFSIHALVGGANSVTSVDVSKHALELAMENGTLNGHDSQHELLCGDAFQLLDQLVRDKRKFDVVVIDPPAFAKQASEINRAIEQYRRLAKLGATLLSPNGTLLLASCSSRVTTDAFFDVNHQALQHTGLVLKKKTFHDIDHPIGFKEGAYLKAGYYHN